MKQIKTLLMTGFVAASAFGLASAQTPIYITGSTAYRNQATAAIKDLLNTGYIEAMVGTADTGNAAIFQGTLKSGGTSVIIKTSWSGSGAGVQTVAGQQLVNFLKTPSSFTATVQNLPDPTTLPVGDSTVDAETPHFAMSDVFQTSTGFLGKVLVNSVQKTYPALTETKVGVVPFQWVVSKDGKGIVTNMTPQLAKSLFSNGVMSLALFTGNSSDEGSFVYATGRNPDSGTRLTAFSEVGISLSNDVIQLQPLDTNGNKVAALNTPIENVQYWPSETINGITLDEGNSGYSSGGDMAKAMSNTSADAGGFFVTYLSTGDATPAVNGGNGAATLTYNGFAYSVAAVAEGQYTFWGYEHLDYLSSLSGVPRTFADALATQIANVEAQITLPSMHVVRQVDGGVVTQNY